VLLARSLPLAFGLACVPVCFELGRALGGERTGRLAAMVAALSPTLVFASGSLLPGTLSTLPLALSMLALVSLRVRPTVGAAAGLLSCVLFMGLDDRAALLPVALAALAAWATSSRRATAAPVLIAIGVILVIGVMATLAPTPGASSPTWVDSPYMVRGPLGAALRFLAPTRILFPGENPLIDSDVAVVVLLYLLPLLALALVALASRGLDVGLRAILGAMAAGCAFVEMFHAGRAYRVAAAPELVVLASAAAIRIEQRLHGAAPRPGPTPANAARGRAGSRASAVAFCRSDG